MVTQSTFGGYEQPAAGQYPVGSLDSYEKWRLNAGQFEQSVQGPQAIENVLTRDPMLWRSLSLEQMKQLFNTAYSQTQIVGRDKIAARNAQAYYEAAHGGGPTAALLFGANFNIDSYHPSTDPLSANDLQTKNFILTSVGRAPEQSTSQTSTQMTQDKPQVTTVPANAPAIPYGPTTDGQPQTGTSTSETGKQIMDKYKAGGFGQVGSPTAIEAVTTYLAQMYKNGGYDTARAAEAAKAYFESFAQDAGAATGAAATGAGAGTAGGAVDPLAGSRSQVKATTWSPNKERQEDVSGTEAGRRMLFGAGVRSQQPASVWRDYLEGRFEPAQAEYQVQRGLGNPESGGGFGGGWTDYASGSQAGMPIDPDLWKAYAQSSYGLMNTPENNNMSEQQAAYRDWLQDSPKNQYDVALQSQLARTPGPLRDVLKRKAGNRYTDMFINDPKAAILDWFMKNGGRF